MKFYTTLHLSKHIGVLCIISGHLFTTGLMQSGSIFQYRKLKAIPRTLLMKGQSFLQKRASFLPPSLSRHKTYVTTFSVFLPSQKTILLLKGILENSSMSYSKHNSLNNSFRFHGSIL